MGEAFSLSLLLPSPCPPIGAAYTPLLSLAHLPETDWHKKGGTSSVFPATNRGFPWSPGTSRSSPSADKARLVDWTLVSILMDGCAILAAAIFWNARTLPITPRAFRETAWPLERFLVLRGAVEESGEGERDASGSVLTSS